MKNLSIFIFPLLLAAILSDCSNPVDSETLAKARNLALAKTLRNPQDNSASENEQTAEPNEVLSEEQERRESEGSDE